MGCTLPINLIAMTWQGNPQVQQVAGISEPPQ